MYRPSFLQHIEAIKKEFEILAQESLTVRGMMKEHEERALFIKKEIKTIKSCVLTMQQQIKGQRCEIDLPKVYKPAPSHLLRLKVGAGWFVENEHVADIKLEQNLFFASAISLVIMSPNGEWVGVACTQTIYVYSMQERTLYSLNTKTEAIERVEATPKTNIFREYDMKIVFSMCSSFLYTEMGDLCIRKWDLGSKSATKFEFPHQVVAWAAVEDELVIASSTNLFTFRNGDISYLKVDECGISTILTISDSVFGLGTFEGKLFLFNYKENELKEFVFHTKSIRSLDVSHDRRMLISASLDKTIVVYEMDVERLELRMLCEPFFHDDVVLCTKFLTPNHFASCSKDQTIRVWSLDRREMRICAHDGPVVGIAAHGNTLVSASVDRRLRIWSLDFK